MNNFFFLSNVWSFPGGSDGKEFASSARDPVQSLGQEDSLEKGMETHCSILAWRILGTESLEGYSPWGCKELDPTERLILSLSLIEVYTF